MPAVLRRPDQGVETMRCRVLVLVLCTLATAGCGGGNAHPSPSPSASAMTEERLLAIGRQHAQCLRNHGLSGVTEPTVWHGTLRFGGPQSPGDRATADAAYQACKSIQDQVAARYLYENWTPAPADVDAIRRFADCVRQHGFPDWPGPNGDGRFPIGGTHFEEAVKTDAWMEAFQACQNIYDGPLLTVTP
jgi:hypothetical protein